MTPESPSRSAALKVMSALSMSSASSSGGRGRRWRGTPAWARRLESSAEPSPKAAPSPTEPKSVVSTSSATPAAPCPVSLDASG